MNCSVIGYGNFSRTACYYLKEYFNLFVYDINQDIFIPDYIVSTDLETALGQDIVILSLPVQYIEDFLKRNYRFFKKGTIVVDICSVKLKPVSLMKHYLPDGVHFIGTHPLFGPQSIKNGLSGHKIVLSSEVQNKELYEKVKYFLKNTLQLEIIEMTSSDHDKEMARVQALNHFIVRALKKLNLQPSSVATPAYNKLFDLYETLKYDSDDLFYTIQRENPYADDLRKTFINILEDIEGDILNEK